MPEDVTAKLARFSPTGLDRDATLFATGFAAGKAAGRRAAWKWLAAALAVSNAVTLAALVWPRSSPVVVTEPNVPPVVPGTSAEEPYGPPAPSSYLALLKDVDAGRSPAPAAGDSPPACPLTPRALADPRFY
jgi:hypothetical protein